MLTDETIRRHLEGEITVRLYGINPANQRCEWVAIDADYRNAIEDLLKLQYRLTQDGVEPALEMSKRGSHLWATADAPAAVKYRKLQAAMTNDIRLRWHARLSLNACR